MKTLLPVLIRFALPLLILSSPLSLKTSSYSPAFSPYPSPVDDDSRLVEIVRFCWRKSEDSHFINHEPHFDMKSYQPWYLSNKNLQDEFKEEAANDSSKFKPLVDVKKSLSKSLLPKGNPLPRLRNVFENASSLAALNQALSIYDKVPFLISEEYITVAHIAAMQNNVPVLKRFLERFPRAISNFILGMKSTPLHVAVLFNSVDAARFLLTLGADIYAEDRRGCTPFDLAVSIGNSEMIKAFLEDSSLLRDSNGPYASMQQAVRLAVDWGMLSEAVYLFEAGCRRHLVDPRTGGDLLHLACFVGDLEAVKALRPYFDLKVSDEGFFSVHYALLNGHYGILEAFTPEELLHRRDAFYTLLDVAVMTRDEALFRIIFEFVDNYTKLIGADPIALQAAFFAVKHDFIPALKVFFERGLRPSSACYGISLIGFALREHYFWIVDWMISKYGIRYLQSARIFQCAAPDFALLKGDMVILEYLLNKGLLGDFTMENGMSSIDFACETKNMALFELLSRY